VALELGIVQRKDFLECFLTPMGAEDVDYFFRLPGFYAHHLCRLITNPRFVFDEEGNEEMFFLRGKIFKVWITMMIQCAKMMYVEDESRWLMNDE